MGYSRAGFEVVGVDIKPQPRYPFLSFVADALEYLAAVPEGLYDAIHASPPCQRYSVMKVMANARQDHPDLLEPTRALLRATGLPYVIENVPGAPMEHLVRLCGSSFGLGVEVYDGWRQLRRHRYFETTFSMLAPPCQHIPATIGLYGDHLRDRRRKGLNGKGLDFPDWMRVPYGGAAMGIDWMEWDELREAIPPAYTEYVGGELLAHLRTLEVVAC